MFKYMTIEIFGLLIVLVGFFFYLFYPFGFISSKSMLIDKYNKHPNYGSWKEIKSWTQVANRDI